MYEEESVSKKDLGSKCNLVRAFLMDTPALVALVFHCDIKFLIKGIEENFYQDPVWHTEVYTHTFLIWIL